MWIYYVNLKLQVEIENNNDFKIKLLQITSFRWVSDSFQIRSKMFR